jgi:hypothetical protein
MQINSPVAVIAVAIISVRKRLNGTTQMEINLLNPPIYFVMEVKNLIADIWMKQQSVSFYVPIVIERFML